MFDTSSPVLLSSRYVLLAPAAEDMCAGVLNRRYLGVAWTNCHLGLPSDVCQICRKQAMAWNTLVLG